MEDFLLNFGGCLIIVSHDRWLMNKLVDHIFVFEGDGKIKDYYGNYTEYRQAKDRELRIQKKIEKANRPVVEEQPVRENVKKKRSYKEQRELEQLEQEISDLEKEKSDIEGKMALGQGTPEEFAEWGRRYNEINTLLEEKGDRWLELSEIGE